MIRLGSRPKTAATVEGPLEPGAAMALVLAARAGDERAMARVLELVAPRVGRVVRVVLGFGHPEAEDVTQLALISFTQALSAFRGECEPFHYASRIAVRTAVHARRRYRTMRARQEEFAEVDEVPTSTPYDAAAAEYRKTLLRDLLGELPAEQAEALALRVALGWSLEEIAAASAAPVNTIRSRLRLAKEALRRRIERDPLYRDELEVVR
ncbi:MAG TPA: sigma-70 family RNA polymerase sigma factor [Polyangiaceae bacterium]|nr:sigma-70 family RNA polymerase sigma factor [Polyangiaceae bacterium]